MSLAWRKKTSRIFCFMVAVQLGSRYLIRHGDMRVPFSAIWPV